MNAVESRVATLEASYTDHDAEFNNRLRSLEALRGGAVTADRNDRLAILEKATKELCAWRPDVDGVLDDIRISVQKMAKTHARAVFDETPPSTSVGNSPTKAAANVSEVFPADLPVFGRCVEPTTRDTGPGVVTTWLPVPAKGTCSDFLHASPSINIPCSRSAPPPLAAIPNSIHHQSRPPKLLRSTPSLPPRYPPPRPPESPHQPPNTGRLPKLPFPKFDGENPHRWRSLCEKYFNTYEVHPSIWVSLVEHYVEGAAASWYQSLAPQLPMLNWTSFCQLLHDRFDRDQHESLLRQMFNIRQNTTVSAYVSAFSQLVDQLTVYSPSADPLFFSTRFMDGLRPDIRAIVVMQRPQNFDTACRLALLQEEVASAKPYRPGDWSSSYKSTPTVKTPLSLPPPPKVDRATVPFAPATAATKSPNSTLKAIKAYRRALGLCFKCGGKWSKDHQCSPEVLLAVEAIWQDFQDDGQCITNSPPQCSEEQVFIAISKAALQGATPFLDNG